jgi:hypothetical protein
MDTPKRAADRERRVHRSAQVRDGGDHETLDELKEEVADEIGIDPDRYGGDVPAKKWGALGGHMVKRLIARGKKAAVPEEGDGRDGSSR